MKHIITTLTLCLGLFFSTQAQIVITEIHYNQPGSDNYEYIELFNLGVTNVDLTGWSFTQGIVYTFPSITLNIGDYLVIVNDSLAFQNDYGITAYEWDSNSLSNGGEDIILVDDMGMGIDTVDYDDFNPWPRIADGFGPSLELCNVTFDNNDPANWSFSTTPLGVRVADDSTMIFGTPGAANGTCPTGPYIFTNGSYATVSEGGDSVEVTLIMANTGAMDTADVDLIVQATSTATSSDYTIPATKASFTSAGVGGWTFVDMVIYITDDMTPEFDETIVIDFAMPTMGASIAAMGEFTVVIIDDDTPLPNYPIGLVTADGDGDGEADSTGVRCELRGVVYGVNIRTPGSGIQFTMRDSTDGVNVFSFDYNDYTVTQGDSIHVFGEMTSFNGLSEIEPDTIVVISQGNALAAPVDVTSLDETTESEYIRLSCVSIVDTSDWPGMGSSRNLQLAVGSDTLTMRIDSDTDIDGTPVQLGVFDLVGIGGQFDGSAPRTSGYQIFPMFVTDFTAKGPNVGFSTGQDVVGEGDGNANYTIEYSNWRGALQLEVSLDAAASTATEGVDFTFTTDTIDIAENAATGCAASNDSWMVAITDDGDIEGNETIVLVLKSLSDDVVVGTDTLTITIEDNDNVGIADLLPASSISLYPNPAQNILVLDASIDMKSIEITNLVGQRVLTADVQTRKEQVNVSRLARGTYFMRVNTSEGVWVQKFVKE